MRMDPEARKTACAHDIVSQTLGGAKAEIRRLAAHTTRIHDGGESAPAICSKVIPTERRQSAFWLMCHVATELLFSHEQSLI